jgi:hypothetical protein
MKTTTTLRVTELVLGIEISFSFLNNIATSKYRNVDMGESVRLNPSGVPNFIFAFGQNNIWHASRIFLV